MQYFITQLLPSNSCQW